MKKVININFQGQVIAIEETAYEILKQYIGSLKSYFSREESGEEIVNDIECRIAELFGNRLKHGINCITDEDVRTIIDSIGRPQDFDSEYAGNEEESRFSNETKEKDSYMPNDKSDGCYNEKEGLRKNAGDQVIGGVCSGLAHYFKTDPVWIRLLFVLFFGILFWVYIVLWIVLKPEVLESNVSKRLYRNPNDRIIGGVCGGIAAYFRIDSWIPRVLFLVPIVLNMVGMVSIFPLNRLFDNVGFNWNFNMSMVVIYVILWAVIPAAKTVKQKLEMMGEEEYIRSIREKVNDNVVNSRSRIVQSPASQRQSTLEGNVSSSAEEVNQDVETTEMPPEPPGATAYVDSVPTSHRSGCFNAILVFFKIVFFSFVGFFLLIMLAVLIGLLVTGTHLLPMKSLFIDSGLETNMMFVSLGLLFLVPVVGTVVWIIRRTMKVKSRPVIGVVTSLLWVAGLVLGGVLGAQVANKFSIESSTERSVEVTPVPGKLYLEMQPYTEDYAEFKTGYGPGAYADNLPYTTIYADSLLFNNINLQIGQSSDSLFHVRVISATHGKDLRTAKADVSQFSYPIIQKDSLLFLPEFFSVPIEQGFRDQSVTVQISVPAGKTIEMSEALRDYKDNRPPAVVRKRIRNNARSTGYTPVSASGEENVSKQD